MTKQPDPVFAGLSLGLKPVDLDLPPDTITIDTELLRARERLRTVKATERLADLAERSLSAQLRTAQAAERQADALEVVAALFASVIGVANAKCGIGPDERTDVVNFLRTGRGVKDFPCDADVRLYAAEENESD